MEAKIVFTGPPNSGKTTAIGVLSDTPPIVNDVSNHDAGLAKSRTTVGMDYGVVSLGGSEQCACSERRARALRFHVADPGAQCHRHRHPDRQLPALSRSTCVGATTC